MQTVTAKDWLGNEYPVDVANLSWRPAAYGVVIRDDAILLVKLDKGYDLPGGGVELGEPCEQAVIREVQEESGIIARNPRLLAVDTDFFRTSDGNGGGEFVQSVLLYYACEYSGGELSKAGLGPWERQHVEGAEWVPLTELEHIRVASSKDYRKYVWNYHREQQR
jgi:8-oxo-dGTP diphosphatase